MKTAFVLLLLALMILPAMLVIRLRLARVRREMAEQARRAEGEDENKEETAGG